MTAKRAQGRRCYKAPTPQSLTNAATFYLSRYAACEKALRRVLKNKLRRAALANETFAADHDAQRALLETIERIIEKYKESGALNDKSFAEMKVASLRRAGKSARRIAQTLEQKGVDHELVAKALFAQDEETGQEAELNAARAFARKKRLGPFSKDAQQSSDSPATTPASRAKAFAALARAGFSPDTIRKVL